MTASDKSYQHNHKVLTAGSLSGYSHAAGQALKDLNISVVHAEDADSALQMVQSSRPAFSIIICDNRIQEMNGTDLLRRVRTSSADTLRFLVSENFDPAMVAEAVNLAGVHRCIQTPYSPEVLSEIIKNGLSEFEQNQTARRMFHLARKQNGKLYELNCELIETTKSYEKELAHLEQEVEKLGTQLKGKTLKRPLPPGKLVDKIRQYLETGQKDPSTVLASLYEEVLVSLHADFTDLALGNGIELPEFSELTAGIPTQEHPLDTASGEVLETDKADKNE